MNIVCSSLKLDIFEVHLYRFSKWNVFSSGLFIKQFHLNTLDGNIDVVMKNNYNFTKKVFHLIKKSSEVWEDLYSILYQTIQCFPLCRR